ncbi:DnaA/Hda family protein [Pontixanthobacter aestiaquae]|uniref:ATPase n=1 Tax=Pontixanthobacter aestiaquae TaxID=1509367 RepID=A0A844ZB42_9SPHN|nr:DnaA/Hda family protein [Pontixanthobacter aestiaquae]MDN3644889.1 DnaA/Hda family protein [Pontixanthobacter aestiaquae]MXO84110.1 ATPase [Pontixanthobacter aestiaquae]
MSQIALPLSHKRAADPERIVVGNANQKAIEVLRNPDAWPFKTAILTGEERSGKSILGRWFAAQDAGDTIDGADALDETDLFHRWNRAQEEGRPLLLISDAEKWEIELPDLRSRLGAALHLTIGTPDDDMAASLIESIAMQRGLALGEGALTYLVPRAERSFAAIERLVMAIDRLSLERKAPATQGIWRDALEAVQGPEQARLF